MPQTHDAGNSFFHLQRHPKGAPLVVVSITHEVEEPFRLARSVAVRLWPLRTSVVLGRWRPETALWDDEDPEIDVRLSGALSASLVGDVNVVKSWSASS